MIKNISVTAILMLTMFSGCSSDILESLSRTFSSDSPESLGKEYRELMLKCSKFGNMEPEECKEREKDLGQRMKAVLK